MQWLTDDDVQIGASCPASGKRPSQRIVRHMGSAPDGPLMDSLIRLAERAILQMQEARQPHRFPGEYLAALIYATRHENPDNSPLPITDARTLKETKRLTVGLHEVLGARYARVTFQEVFGTRRRMAGHQLRQVVLMRLAAPFTCNRACCDAVAPLHVVAVSTDTLCRMMDALDAGRIARFQSIVFYEARGLLDDQVEVLCFDVATLPFASAKHGTLRRGK